MRIRVRLVSCAILLSALLGASSAWADQAVCVGINHYVNLPKENQLEGCVNDAHYVGTALAAKGFHVTYLTDEHASRQGILGLLAQMKRTIKPSERFVFFFAGHGCDDPVSILSSTAEISDPRNYIRQDVLYNAIRQIRAKSRTVLLDSCFSGAMTRAIFIGAHIPNLRRRYFHRKRRSAAYTGSKDLTLVNHADNPSFLASAQPVSATTESASAVGKPGPVCYFCAARRDEVANEGTFGGGEDHGVFTYFLVHYLNQVHGPELWSGLQPEVSSGVCEKLHDQQHPTISPAYLTLPIFSGPNAAPQPQMVANSGSLWQLYNTDSVNPSEVSLIAHPNRAQVSMSDELSFSTKIGMSGYLLIVEHGTSGKLHLLYPRSGKLDDARVTAGSKVDIPDPGQAYKPDQEGVERIRALLFEDRERATKLIGGLMAAGATEGGATMDDLVRSLKNRDFVKMSRQRSRFYTSDVILTVLGQ